MSTLLQLADYRRRVHTLYSQVQDQSISIEERWLHWIAVRDELFGSHPQSALSPEQAAGFRGLRYYQYDPAWRLLVELDTEVENAVFEIPLQHDGRFEMQRIGRVALRVGGQAAQLSLFWIRGYGGGLFLPFRDASGRTGDTYPGTRYVLDTIKGADLGEEDGKLVLDFNFAYNPSCAYHHRWQCPLAPQENWLDLAIEAGEKNFTEKDADEHTNAPR